MARALLFDVGDVLLENNWELLRMMGEREGRRVGAQGPLDPDNDPHWQLALSGEITNDEYWDRVARDEGHENRIALWRSMSDLFQGDTFAKDSMALVDQALAAGIAVGILSNDLVRASGREWVDAQTEFKRFAVIVDSTEFGQRKPAPAIYLHAAERLGFPMEDIVFLDDMPYCIEGALAVGMQAILVDPLQRGVAFDEARRRVGLPVPDSETAR